MLGFLGGLSVAGGAARHGSFKTQDKIPQFVSRDYENTTVISSSQAAAISEPGMVSGTHRYKFFKRPLLPSGPPPAHLAPVPPAAQPVPVRGSSPLCSRRATSIHRERLLPGMQGGEGSRPWLMWTCFYCHVK